MSTVSSQFAPASYTTNEPELRVYERSLEERLWSNLRQHGSFSLAYHTMQPGVEYFETTDGFIAYEKKWGYTFVLADPVVSPENRETAIEDFLNNHKRVSFCQITEPIAELLHDRGFKVNEFGTEFEIDIPSYTMSGKKKRHIKEAVNRIRNLNMTVEEFSSEDLNREEVEAVSEAWRATKYVSEHETRFLSRGIVLDDEPDVRKFYLVGEEGIVAYIYFDPIYRDGEVIGYLSNSKRNRPDAPRDFDFAITWHAVERFREEGKEVLSFGMAPFYEVTDEKYRHNRFTHRALNRIYHRPKKWLYNFQGMAAHKRRYRGTQTKVYFATTAFTNMFRMLVLGRVCKML